ncbi:restriction endonuclease subunit S, partial [Limosilactobacillus reuteri]
MDKKPEKLVPEVRFKGFTDDWEQHKLGEISFKVNTKNKENLTLPVLSNSAEYGIVNQEDYFDKKIANRTDNYYIVKHNDFVYNPRISKKAPYGPIRRNTLDTKGLMSPLYYVFRINDGNYIYLDYYFKSSKWYKFMYQNGDSGARSDRFAIKDKIFQMMPINMPNTKEQNKIGQLIQTLQKLIDLQQRKLEFLKEIKKGLLQKMFADKSKFPILRFEGFHNEWEQRKLKNVYQKIGNAFVGTASPYYVDAGHFYLESNNIKNGQINRNHEVFINNSFYQKQSNKLLHTGDLVMVQSGHVGDTAVITQEYNNSAAHALIMFRNPKDKFLSDYLNFYFQNTSAKNKINVLAIGNTIRHVLASDMSRFSVYFPNKDERKYISNLLLKLQYTI